MIETVEDITQTSNEVECKTPTFKTEVTISVNSPNDSGEENEDLVIRGADNKTTINKSAYSNLHKLSNNRLSISSLGRYDIFKKSGKLPKALLSKPPEPDINGPKHFHFIQPSKNSSTKPNSDEESEDYIPCVLRKSESVETVDKIEKELSNFIMDPSKKEKKRTSSFRKLFSVSLFGKDKKKKEKSVSSIPNTDYVDNYQNETFIRNSPQRHTVGCTHFKHQTSVNVDNNVNVPKNIEEDPPPEIIRQYAHMHINKFNKIRRSFEDQGNEDPNDKIVTKYIDTSSSTNSTLESSKQHTYQNALIAQAELQQSKQDNRYILTRSDSLRRETPPRAQDTYQPVNIVKPKARLPINSGRPLPNPYQYNTESIIRNEEVNPKLSEIYGTVFDAIDRPSTNRSSNSPQSPRSPSFEVSKLKLPPNREITPLQPRLRSPLPPSKVSAEKMIATELLKNSTNDHSEKRTSQEQTVSVSEALNALRNKLEVNDQNLKEELDQIKHTLSNLTHNETVTPDLKPVVGDPNSPRSTLMTSSRSSITISPLPQHLRTSRASPVQPCNSPDIRNSISSVDVELRHKNSIPRNYGTQQSPSSPSKDDIRRSVEAYYWKEIKKIKEREDYEIYLSHLQFSQGGYAEDPNFTRRSRGLDDSRGRRSSSVPRNPRQLTFETQNEQLTIPDGRSLMYNPHGNNIYGYANPRNSQLQNRSPKLISTNNENCTYKPIFRRGSLSGGIPQQIQTNKKVSFSNSRLPENFGVWPTKNGFTKSPPQRRLEKPTNSVLEDDVFLPTQQINPEYQIYGRTVKNNYTSDNESIYGGSKVGYGYNMAPNQRLPTYNSDSETIYGTRQRRFKTMSHQEMENLRNSQSNGVRLTPRITRHESIQLPEPMYGYAPQYGMVRGSQQISPQIRDQYVLTNQNKISYNTPRRHIVITDNIYGQHVGYRNDHSPSHNVEAVEPIYVPRSKQVTVRNKVCDMYGRIHDIESSGEVQATGVLMGQLQKSPNSPSNFRRGTRLTASNSDMHMRQDNYLYYATQNQSNNSPQVVVKGAPVRPLPPLPPTGKAAQKDSKQSNSKRNSSKKKKK